MKLTKHVVEVEVEAHVVGVGLLTENVVGVRLVLTRYMVEVKVEVEVEVLHSSSWAAKSIGNNSISRYISFLSHPKSIATEVLLVQNLTLPNIAYLANFGCGNKLEKFKHISKVKANNATIAQIETK